MGPVFAEFAKRLLASGGQCREVKRVVHSDKACGSFEVDQPIPGSPKSVWRRYKIFNAFGNADMRDVRPF